MSHYFNKIYGVFLALLSRLLLMFYSQRNKRILISCSEGMFYNGNSKQLFESMYSQGKDVYFITRNKDILKKLKLEYGNKIIFSYSFYALYIFVTSRIIILSNGIYDITPFFPFHKSKKVINLWHGFPFKAIGAKMENLSPKQINNFLNVYSKTNFMISSSETETEILSESFGIPKCNIVETGYPRYDMLLLEKNNLLADLNLPIDKKVLLYAPTYRDATDLILFPFDDFNSSKLNDFLVDENILLLVRLHKNDRHKIEGKIQFNERIVYLDQNMLEEVNEILPFIDLLITDYSGIFMDFAVLKKPMIFIPYDIEEYTADRGMNVYLLDIYPGEVVDSFDKFKINVRLSLDNNNLPNEKLDSFLSKFHQYESGMATHNLIKFIDSI